MPDLQTVRVLAAYAGLKLDRPDELADARDLLDEVLAHRGMLDDLDLDGIRPAHVFCFQHTARESAGP